jgi:hypothetical protein
MKISKQLQLKFQIALSECGKTSNEEINTYGIITLEPNTYQIDLKNLNLSWDQKFIIKKLLLCNLKIN